MPTTITLTTDGNNKWMVVCPLDCFCGRIGLAQRNNRSLILSDGQLTKNNFSALLPSIGCWYGSVKC